jgi:hypothetical protein
MKQRDHSIDIMKGLLVYGMILAHVIQFFSPFHLFEGSLYISDFFINLITFSGFFFCFGYTSDLSYYRKPFKNVFCKMLVNTFKTLVAFYISGVFFRLFISNSPLQWETLKNIITLNDIPGWSEFLVSFTLVTLLGLLLFKPIQFIVERKLWFIVICAGLLCTTFIPYESVTSTQLGLLIGTTEYASFPVLQYFPYYLIGVFFARHRTSFNYRYLFISLVASAVFIFKWTDQDFTLPQRFPPSIYWILGPAMILYGYYLLSKVLSRFSSYLEWLLVPGRNVLFYLLVSNIIIFTLKSKQPYWTLSTYESVGVTIILTLFIYYLTKIISPYSKPIGK